MQTKPLNFVVKITFLQKNPVNLKVHVHQTLCTDHALSGHNHNVDSVREMCLNNPENSKGPKSHLTMSNALEHPVVKIYTTGWRCSNMLTLNFNDQQNPVNKTAATSYLLAYIYVMFIALI